MEKVLRGLHWSTCLVYLDNIIVFSKMIEEHLERLAQVLSRLRDAGLKLKPTKCHLFKKSVHYLGHVISEKGIETDPEKVKCIRDWPTPMSSKELHQFIGLASYYRKFMKDFANIAAPLHALAVKGKVWVWTEQCEQAFNTLKYRLTSTSILILPRYDQEFILDVDASGDGLGAVLSQIIDGKDCVVAYASRTLTKAERKYCATRREMLALVWGIGQYRPYIYGQPFTVRTDHNALQWLQYFQEPEGQVARWLEILSEYNF